MWPPGRRGFVPLRGKQRVRRPACLQVSHTAMPPDGRRGQAPPLRACAVIRVCRGGPCVRPAAADLCRFGRNSVSGGPRVSKSATQPCLQMAGGDKPRPYARACAVIRVCRGGPCGRPAAADLCRFGGNSVSGGPRVSKSATQPCLQMAGGDKPRPYGPVRSSVSVGAALVSARPPRICAASGETACQAARVSPSRPHSHASRWRAGTTPAPTPGPARSPASVGAALVAARPYDSGRVKWARGSGRSHSTTAPAARDLGTSISRWLALPRNRAA